MVEPDPNFDSALIAGALEWWHDAGVDVLVEGNPRDWFAAPPPAPPRAASVPAAPVAPTLPDTLEAFLAWRTGADAPETPWGGDTVLADGPADAEYMVLLDQPDRDDCAAKRLLSGPAGRLYDRMLASVGLSRETVHTASVCVRRHASGRPPRDDERRLAEVAMHHLSLTKPRRLLLLGNAASRAVLGADAASARGILHAVGHKGGMSGAVAGFHPRFLLERPMAKGEAWRDLRLLVSRDG